MCSIHTCIASQEMLDLIPLILIQALLLIYNSSYHLLRCYGYRSVKINDCMSAVSSLGKNKKTKINLS